MCWLHWIAVGSVIWQEINRSIKHHKSSWWHTCLRIGFEFMHLLILRSELPMQFRVIIVDSFLFLQYVLSKATGHEFGRIDWHGLYTSMALLINKHKWPDITDCKHHYNKHDANEFMTFRFSTFYLPYLRQLSTYCAMCQYTVSM